MAVADQTLYAPRAFADPESPEDCVNRSILACALFGFAAMIASCGSQGSGDTCQVSRDCDTGLHCCAKGGFRGTCEATCDTGAVADAGVGDAQTGEDAMSVDESDSAVMSVDDGG